MPAIEPRDYSPARSGMGGTPSFMSSLPSFVRCERKWISHHHSDSELRWIVKRHPAAFRTAYPARWINNLYFDTPDWDHYRDHVSGVASRLKVRIRWYGESNGAVRRPVLEIKRKRGVVNWKDSVPLLDTELPVLLTPRVLSAWLQEGGHLAGVLEVVRGVRPALFNRYHREYYVSGDGQARLTIDRALIFRSIPGLVHGSVPATVAPLRWVMEVKYLPVVEESVAVMAQGFPFRFCRCSKYVLGVQQMQLA